MAFVKGQSGNPKGKPKGAKNLVKPLDVADILRKELFNPFIELVDLARNAKSEKVRCEATIELCSYVAPKLKQVEFVGDSQAPFVISLNMAGGKVVDATTITVTPSQLETAKLIEENTEDGI